MSKLLMLLFAVSILQFGSLPYAYSQCPSSSGSGTATDEKASLKNYDGEEIFEDDDKTDELLD